MADDIAQTTNPASDTNNQPDINTSNDIAQTVSQDQSAIQKNVNDELLNQDIFKVMKLENISDQEKEDLKQKMIDTVTGRIIARVMDKLNLEEQKNFEALLDSGNNAEIEKFIDSKMNIKDIIAQETILYKSEMIDNAQKIDDMVKKAQSVQSSEDAPTTAVV